MCLFCTQINKLNEEIRRYLDPPEFLGFRVNGKLMKDTQMMTAFGKCVSNLIPVVVEKCPYQVSKIKIVSD